MTHQQNTVSARDDRSPAHITSGVTKRSVIMSSVISVAAVASSTLVPSTSLAATDTDPTFAAIAGHREAFIRRMRVSVPMMSLYPGDPREEELEAAETAAREVENDAIWKLANVVPTTMAGVLALLKYVEDIQEQAMELPEDPRNWHSGGAADSTMTMTYEAEGLFDKFNGKPLELPFAYWVMQNVRLSLRALAPLTA